MTPVPAGGFLRALPFSLVVCSFGFLPPAATPVRVLTGTPEDMSGFVAMRSLYLLGGCTQIFDGLWL
jgi:hypothetical protein